MHPKYIFKHRHVCNTMDQGMLVDAGRKVSEVMQSTYVTIGKKSTIQSAALLMKENNIGSLIVTENFRPVGVITEKDITFRVVAENLPASGEKVASHMTIPIVSISRDVLVLEAVEMMKRHGIRRLPVHDENGQVCGIITQSDIAGLSPDKSMEADLRDGSLYYVKASQEHKAFSAFLANLRGRAGLILTSLPPSYVRERYNLVRTPIIHIRERGKGVELGDDVSCDPHDLDALLRLLHDSLYRAHHQVILLHGISELLALNSAKQVLGFLGQLRLLLKSTRGICLVSINPNHPGEMSMLYRQ